MGITVVINNSDSEAIHITAIHADGSISGQVGPEGYAKLTGCSKEVAEAVALDFDISAIIGPDGKLRTIETKSRGRMVYGGYGYNSRGIWITPSSRKRYLDLEGCRKYHAYRKACITVLTYDDDDYVTEEEEVFGSVCRHSPEQHTDKGCMVEEYSDRGDFWDGWKIHCPCNRYTKPAPLVIKTIKDAY